MQKRRARFPTAEKSYKYDKEEKENELSEEPCAMLSEMAA